MNRIVGWTLIGIGGAFIAMGKVMHIFLRPELTEPEALRHYCGIWVIGLAAILCGARCFQIKEDET